MCSLWKTMEESDDGDLEAVVRGYSRMNPYNWQPVSTAGFDPGLSFRSSAAMMFPNLMTMTAPASPVGMDLQDLCRPFYGDGNGSMLRSASSCSSLMFESMEVNAASSSIFAAESSPPPSAAASIRKLGEIKEEKSLEISPRVPEVLGSKPVKVEGLKECDGSSSSLSQALDNGGTAQPVSKAQGSKRRKSQQKRIVCVPAAAGSNRPSGESLPSDLWAWRKYGQKPIKGSPYPRGYYRCSSSKGCSARKQVERSRTDPTMLVITYTSDHNHPWPTHRNALAGSTRQTPSEKNAPAESRAQKQENSDTIIMPENNPDGENNTNNNDSTTSAFSVAGGGGSISSADGENLSSSMIQDDHDPAAVAELRNLFRPEDDFFAELGELPEPLNIFSRQHFDDDKSDEEEAASSVVDPFNLFNWSSLNPTPSPFIDTKTAM
ncbi:hypothetical protein SUGI_0759230 [Cryptomeria japonica]|uniref:probable WRKY transcription factor 29 n=1 Tax=Cryptomeria japonica TaxID=3369 RepID=UPI0024147F0F|nr:probable WRKY transcription factor 29 [Cryptomeria japonica]GLJ37397.1 hypothetical protein SUGI_0759230 [Cryptomeria japonica]